MTRLAFLLLLSSPLIVAGCGGEDDHSKVLPVTNDAPRSTSDAKLPADLTTLKKIPMH